MLENLLRRLRTIGMRRGIRGGSRGWSIVWLAAFALLRWGIRREEVVYSEPLEPGAQLTITHEPPPTKDKRRRARRR
ncbi:MAG TPA: hypothetical protein VF005_01490 [Acidimicrobiales bacterium]